MERPATGVNSAALSLTLIEINLSDRSHYRLKYEQVLYHLTLGYPLYITILWISVLIDEIFG